MSRKIKRRRAPAITAVPSFPPERLMLAAVLLATLLGYLRCLGNGFVYDDNNMIVNNRYIGQWSFLWKSVVNDSWWFMNPAKLPQSSYYRPLQDIWLGLQYHLFGLNPAGWHATMVALHLVVVWLVYKVARRLTLTEEPYAALLAALLFGLLPIHAEAVIWPSAIPLPLAAAFELGAFYCFIGRRQSAGRDWASIAALYAGALLSHESAAAFPALIFFYVLLLESGHEATAPSPALSRERIRHALLATAPLLAELLLYLVVRWLVLGAISRPNPFNTATTAQVLMTIPRVLVAYAVMLAVPWLAAPAHRCVLRDQHRLSVFLPFRHRAAGAGRRIRAADDATIRAADSICSAPPGSWSRSLR